MQRGSLTHDRTSWHLRYQVKTLDPSGKIRWKKAYKRLGEWKPQHGNKLPDMLRDVADKILSPQNQQVKLEVLMPVRVFFREGMAAAPEAGIEAI